jgi:hypothetical protein
MLWPICSTVSSPQKIRWEKLMKSVLSERTTRNKIVPVTKMYGGAYQNCSNVSRLKADTPNNTPNHIDMIANSVKLSKILWLMDDRCVSRRAPLTRQRLLVVLLC